MRSIPLFFQRSYNIYSRMAVGHNNEDINIDIDLDVEI